MSNLKAPKSLIRNNRLAVAVHAQKFNRIPNVNGRVIDLFIGVAHMPDITFCIAAVGIFENRLTSGNDV